MKKVKGKDSLHRTLMIVAVFMGSAFNPSLLFAQGTPCNDAEKVQLNHSYNRTLETDLSRFFRIDIPSVGRLSVSALSNLDTDARLYDKNCHQLQSSPSGGPGENFRLDQEFAAGTYPQVYYVEVFSDSHDSGTYELMIHGDFLDDVVGGSSCNTKPWIVRSTTPNSARINAELSFDNDKDFFQLRIQKAVGQITAEAKDATNTLDTDAVLYQWDGSQFNFYKRATSGGQGEHFRLTVSTLPAGLYCLEVGTDSTNDKGPYTLYIMGDFVSPSGTCGINAQGTPIKATITGTDGNDVLIGTTGDDVISALGGNDVVYGLGGNDIICGGNGEDVINGGDGQDTLYGDAGTSNPGVGAPGNDILRGEQGRDTLYGDAGNDVLDGGSENDTLRGGVGDDLLAGGLGIDNLAGGPGYDVCDDGGDGGDVVATCETSNP
jgi:hypothetical protein